jgi:hypothetical protein
MSARMAPAATISSPKPGSNFSKAAEPPATHPSLHHISSTGTQHDHTMPGSSAKISLSVVAFFGESFSRRSGSQADDVMRCSPEMPCSTASNAWFRR